MKTNGTLLNKRLFPFALAMLLGASGFSQPDYVFKNSSLVSGTDGAAGAVYRFPTVKPGVDAIVTINSLSTGISIADFDDNKNGGFDEAFQPRISALAKTAGYAEFTIAFVQAGTNIPMNMLEVPATSIDVDGHENGKDTMAEVDEYFTPGAHVVDFDMAGTDLSILMNGGSVVGRNSKGLEKTLIDTVAKEAMFSVIYVNITSFTFRIGLSNMDSTSTTRQRSVYFQRFFFTNSFLPVSNLLSFTGNRNAQQDVILNWSVRNGQDYTSVIIERSYDGRTYTSLTYKNVTGMQGGSFTDATAREKSAWYRLQLTDKNGKVSYSTVLFVRAGNDKSKMNVYPTVVSDYMNVQYMADRSGTIRMHLYDPAGRLIMKKDILVQAGSNTVAVDGLSRFAKGQYVLSVQDQNAIKSQKIILTQ